MKKEDIFNEDNKCRLVDINTHTFKHLMMDLSAREQLDISYYRTEHEESGENICALQLEGQHFITQGSGGISQLDRALYHSVLAYIPDIINP